MLNIPGTTAKLVYVLKNEQKNPFSISKLYTLVFGGRGRKN